MNRKILWVLVLGAFLSAGIFSSTATASQLKFTYPMDGINNYVGQVNFTTKPAGDFSWGYCVEPYTYSYWDTWYKYEIIPVTGYYTANGMPNLGLIAADLIWTQYSDKSVSVSEKTKLQEDIWAVYKNYSFYNKNYQFSYDKNYLESLFDIAFVPDVCGWGQDFIVYRPDPNHSVPEPASVLLLGMGCVVFGGYLRKKSKK